MLKEEIINKGIHVYFPDFSKSETNQKKVDNVKTYNLPYVNFRYNGMTNNSHHFTTEYHHKYVIPFYQKLFSLPDDNSNWVLQKNVVMQKDGQNFDLSYFKPLTDKLFHVKCLTKTCEYDCNYSGLLFNEKVKHVTWITPYHELYCLPHLCSIVTNKSNNNGKTLLLIGDSQSVPDVAYLAYYFQKVIYIDNRDGVEITNELEKTNIDYVLFAQNNNNDEYYYNFIK